ncbi:hypothetical protein [Nonomuraea sp. NPDC049028]
MKFIAPGVLELEQFKTLLETAHLLICAAGAVLFVKAMARLRSAVSDEQP